MTMKYQWADANEVAILGVKNKGDVVFIEPDHPDYEKALAANPSPAAVITTPSPQPVAEIRARRDRMLAESDWSMLPDAPTDKKAWGDYRQGLRDVPQQSNFPDAFMWPKKPTE